MRGFIGKIKERYDRWDLLSALLFLLVLALILANLSLFPVFLDMPYHLATTQGYIRAGGIVTWDYWDFAPQGRPQIYPPLLHLLMSIPLKLGISQEAVGTTVSLIMFPLIMLSMWWMIRQLFSSRQAFYSMLILLIPYTFFWQTAVTSAASMVLLLTPLIFLSMERERWVTPAILLAFCLYSHLVLGHLVALALAIYVIHRRKRWRSVAKILAVAYLLYLPWGINVLLHLDSFSISEAGGNIYSIHLFIWLMALLALPLCYIKKGRHYLLVSYFVSMIPIAFFYPNRFWDGHVLLPLAMLGGVTLSTLHEGLMNLFTGIRDLEGHKKVVTFVCLGIVLLPMLIIDPVIAFGGRAGGPVLPGGGGAPGNQYPPELGGSNGTVPLPPPGADVPEGAPRQVNPIYDNSPVTPERNTSPGELAGVTADFPPFPPAPLPHGENPIPPIPLPAGYSPAGIPQQVLPAQRQGDGPRLSSSFTTLLQLAGLDDQNKLARPGSRKMFSEANEQLFDTVKRFTDEDDLVFIPDAIMSDFIFAMTGRGVLNGMFHEVQPDKKSEPLREAKLIIIPAAQTLNARPANVNTPPARQVPGGGGGNALLGLDGDSRLTLAAQMGGYRVYVNSFARGSMEVADPVLPLWAAYLLLVVALLLTAIDVYLGLKSWKRDGDPGEALRRAGEGLDIEEKPENGASFLVAIPCLNEGANIAEVVREVKSGYPHASVLVIDDGSRDDTRIKAAQAGALVVSNGRNRGIGYSLRLAIALALKWGYPFLVRVDGDGQHDPHYIVELLRPLKEGEAEVAVGSRYLEKELRGEDHSTSSLRRKAGKFISLLIRLYTGRSFTDPTSGFWAFSRESMEYLLRSSLLDYPEGEMLISLEKKGLRVREVPVRMRPRANGRSSLNSLKALGYLFELSLGRVFKVENGEIS